jgi:O-antigen ligase
LAGRALHHSAVQAVLALIVALLLAFALTAGIELSVRWTVYLLLVPYALVALVFVRDPVVLLGVLFVPLLFLEQSFISIRSVGPASIGVSLPIFAVVAAALWRQGHRLPRLGLYTWLWAAFLLTALAAAVAFDGEPRIERLRFQTLYLEGFLYFLLGAAAFRSPSDARRFAWVLLACGVGMALLQFAFLRTGIPYLQPNIEVRDLTQDWRYGGPLGNPNSLADFYAVLLPSVLVLLLIARSTVERGALVAAGIALTSALVLTGSRGGVLAGVAAVLLSAVASSRRLMARPWAVPVLVLLVSAGYFVVDTYFSEVFALSLERWEQRGLRDVRTEIWSATLEIIADSPLGLGHDPQAYVQALAHRRPGFFFATPHNVYLGLAVSVGLAGLLAFLAIVGAALLGAVQQIARAGDARTYQLRWMPVLAVVVFLVAAFTEPLYDNGHKLNHVFWFLVGTLVWWGQLRTQEAP